MRLLLFLLLLKALLLGIWIAHGPLGLSPDEAQYWTWSQDLDWGYYSKPPAIAWQIAATTALLGNTVLGIKMGALLIGLLSALAVYALARRADCNEKTAFWAALVFATSPLGFYLSFASTTDGGAILCLTCALTCLLGKPNYIYAGLWVMLGALFKWTAFIFWPFTLLAMLFFPHLRSRYYFLGALLLSLLALLPSLYWNSTHEWATFKHVGKTLVHDRKGGNFFDFLFSQIALFSPVYFGLFMVSYFKRKTPPLRLLALFSAGFFLYLSASLFKKIQPNWASYFYLPAMVLIAWAASRRIWLVLGMALSLVGILGAFSIPLLQAHNLFSIPYKANPFRQTLGWEKLAPALQNAGYDPAHDFLFSDKYQVASILSFYGPEKHRGYFFNISSSRKNQFSYWPGMEVGKTGYFVVVENREFEDLAYRDHYLGRLEPYFEQVEYVGGYPLFWANGKGVKWAFIFRCRGYLGTAPPSVEIY